MKTDWSNRCIFVDNGAPWVASLMASLSRLMPVEYIQTMSLGWVLRHGHSGKPSGSAADTMLAYNVGVPGWQKCRWLSSALLRAAIRRSIRNRGDPAAVVFTLPWYADAAVGIKGVHKIYYAYDPYRFYDWDAELVQKLEARMVSTCDFSLAVSRTLASDLKALGAGIVHYFPNGTAWRPGAAEIPVSPQLLQERTQWRRPVVGCVGKVNYNTYDWDLLESLSGQFADCSFVFVGGLDAQGAEERRIRAYFSLPNVHWLGQKNHAELPAYLAGFDVCINPMLVSPHNNRRSPLRLFDYLTTDKPVVSTAVDETALVCDHIEVARTYEEFSSKLRRALSGQVTVDAAGRRRFIQAQHWDERATTLGRLLGVLPAVSMG